MNLTLLNSVDYDDVTAGAIIRSALDAIVVIDAQNLIVEFNPAAEAVFGYTRAEALGRDVAELIIPPEHRAAHVAGLRKHLETGHATLLDRRLELEATRRDGSRVPIELSVTRLRQAGRPVFAAFIRDITVRRELQVHQLRSQARLTAIVRAQQELAASQQSVTGLLDSLARLAQDALGGDGAALELLEGNELVYRATSDMAQAHQGRRLSVASSLSGQTLQRDAATYSSVAESDPRVDAAAVRSIGLKSMVLAPLHAEGKAVGVLKVMSRQEGFFEEADARSLELLARSVTAVLDRKVGEATRQKALETQAAIVEVQRELATSDLELGSLLDQMAARAQDLVGGSGAAVEFLEGDELVYVSASGASMPQRGLRIPVKQSLSGACLAGDKVLLCSDTETDARVNREACRRIGARSMLVAPMHAQGAVLGVLKVTSEHLDAFGPEQVRNLEILTETLGLLVQRARATAALRRVATLDAVTGLTRFAAAEPAWEASREAHSQCAALLVNLDRFHAINESLGHRRGDEVLVSMANRLTALTSDSIALAHFAGDEYVMFSPACDEAAALAQADRVRESLARPFEGDGYRVQLSATVGVALSPQHGNRVLDIVRRAQFAMEHGKKLGRDRVALFRTDQMQEIEDRVLLGDRLRQAPGRGELELHYQPQVDARSFRITGFEALLRWNHPELGSVPPNRFIPIGEALGLMSDIGGWVLREAARQARAWLDAGFEGFQVSVNVSPHQLQRDGLVEAVADAIAAARLPVGVLEIEVTESSLMENVDRIQGELARLKSLGVSLSLDDFGTGYSSLSCLKQFSLDTLKIDRSFVKGLPGNADDAAIAGMVVSIGHQLRLVVVAEGVETAEQAAFLRQLGCDRLQGYHFSRPLDAEAAARLLSGVVPWQAD